MKEHRIVAALAGVFLASLIACAAFAGTGTGMATAPAPTTYQDGTQLKAADISGYQLECQFTTKTGSVQPCAFSPATAPGGGPLNVPITITYPAVGGKACFQARAIANGVPGDLSPIGPNSCKDFDAAAPGAPGAVTVTITVTVTAPVQ